MEPTYIHGHHESVVRSHMWRTAENSAGYLLGELRPGMELLDVGCGPGTITMDLANLVGARGVGADRVGAGAVGYGRVVGVDTSSEVIEQARVRLAEAGDGARVQFEVADAMALPFHDASFDVVHAHQVLQHLTDPVGALVEMARVVRPGGLVAVRDSIYAAFSWSPADPMLDRWNELYHRVAAANHVDADAGRNLLAWVREAGLVNASASSSTWTFADPASREWWGGLWADRVVHSTYATEALGRGLSTPEELQAVAAAFRTWAEEPSGVFIVVHGEVLARR